MASDDRYRAVIDYRTDYEQEGVWVRHQYTVGPYRTINAVKAEINRTKEFYPWVYYGSPNRKRTEAKIDSIRFEKATLVWEKV